MLSQVVAGPDWRYMTATVRYSRRFTMVYRNSSDICPKQSTSAPQKPSRQPFICPQQETKLTNEQKLQAPTFKTSNQNLLSRAFFNAPFRNIASPGASFAEPLFAAATRAGVGERSWTLDGAHGPRETVPAAHHGTCQGEAFFFCGCFMVYRFFNMFVLFGFLITISFLFLVF